MPRGTCEYCDEHDAFVHAAPAAFGKKAFVCTLCLNLLQPNEGEGVEPARSAPGSGAVTEALANAT